MAARIGTRPAAAQQFAEVLGIPAEDVIPQVGDTDSVGFTSMTGGSSQVTNGMGWFGDRNVDEEGNPLYGNLTNDDIETIIEEKFYEGLAERDNEIDINKDKDLVKFKIYTKKIVPNLIKQICI